MSVVGNFKKYPFLHIYKGTTVHYEKKNKKKQENPASTRRKSTCHFNRTVKYRTLISAG